MSRLGSAVRVVVVAGAVAAIALGVDRAVPPVALADPADRGGLAAASTVLVDEATLVCPGQQRLAGQGLRDVDGTVVLAAAGAPAGVVADAVQAVASPVARADGTPIAGAAPGTVSSSAPDAAADLDTGASLTLESGELARPVATGGAGVALVTTPSTTPEITLARGKGSLAAGSVATQTWQRRGDDDRGLAVTPCVAPTADVWLVGGGAGASRNERVIVANPGANAVRVSLTVHGTSGVVAAPPGGTAVPPRSRLVVSLDALAPGEASPAVHVVATGGVVTAVLDDAWIEGATARGMEDATRAASPATELLVPGVDVSGAAFVRLVNPGQSEALAQVRVLTTQGGVQPAELRAVRVAAGATLDVPLRLAPGPVGLRVSSDRPVVAGAWVERLAAPSADRMGDFAWAPATAALRGVAGLTLPGLAPTGTRRSLLLASGPSGGRARVYTVVDEQRRQVTVTVGADSAAYLDIGAADRVWVVPVQGDVHAAVSVTGDDAGVPMFSVAALTSAPLTVVSIPVRQVER